MVIPQCSVLDPMVLMEFLPWGRTRLPKNICSLSKIETSAWCAAPPPPSAGVGKPSMDSECASGCTWSTAQATARLRDSQPPE